MKEKNGAGRGRGAKNPFRSKLKPSSSVSCTATHKSKGRALVIEYNESARHDYLTGFHKRKVERKKQAKLTWEAKQREEAKANKVTTRKKLLDVSVVERIEAIGQRKTSRDGHEDKRTNENGDAEDEKESVVVLAATSLINTITDNGCSKGTTLQEKPSLIITTTIKDLS